MPGEHCLIQECEQHYQYDAGNCGERRVPPPKVICGEKCGKKIKDQAHSLRGDQKIQYRSNHY
jgi:hypothetical protein